MAEVKTDLKEHEGALGGGPASTLEEAEALLGPEPDTMGFTKNMFWGRFQRRA